MRVLIYSDNNELLVVCAGDDLQGMAFRSGAPAHTILEHELGHEIGSVGPVGSGCNLELDQDYIHEGDIVTIPEITITRNAT